MFFTRDNFCFLYPRMFLIKYYKPTGETGVVMSEYKTRCNIITWGQIMKIHVNSNMCIREFVIII